MIIHVKGIPGSGKTWICSAVANEPNVVCVDLDDIVSKVYFRLKESPKFLKALSRKPPARGPSAAVKTIMRACEKFVTDICKQETAKGKLVVLVGISMYLSAADKRFFIRMSKDDLAAAYRRVIVRELEKIMKSAEDIRKAAATGDIATLGYDLSFGKHLNVIGLTTLFSDYKGMYSGALQFEKKNGLTVATQKQIIDFIRRSAARGLASKEGPASSHIHSGGRGATLRGPTGQLPRGRSQ